MGLLTFIENSLNRIQSCSDDLPGKVSFALERMIQERWLQSYSDLEGMRQTLVRISRRRPIVKKVIGAARLMEANERKLLEFFRRFHLQLLMLSQAHESVADEVV